MLVSWPATTIVRLTNAKGLVARFEDFVCLPPRLTKELYLAQGAWVGVLAPVFTSASYIVIIFTREGKKMPVVNAKREFIPNQVFVGLPWKTVRPKYERIIRKLEGKFPLHFTIVGRNDGQDAEDLFDIIKQRISSSSYAVFDATGGNANVSLEFGYAEGIEVPRAIFLSAHKAAQKLSATGPIISDLHGRRRVPYKNERALSNELHKLCREHDYTRRFERALKTAATGLKTKGKKKRARTLAIKTIRTLDAKAKIRRAQLVQHLQAMQYSEQEVDFILRKLHSAGVLKCTVGKYSEAYIA